MIPKRNKHKKYDCTKRRRDRIKTTKNKISIHGRAGKKWIFCTIFGSLADTPSLQACTTYTDEHTIEVL